MALFDGLIGEVASKYGLGAQATPFVREVVNLIAGGPGGLTGFLDKMKMSSSGSEVNSWIGGSGAPTVLAPGAVGSALGQPAIEGIAQRIGLSSAVAGTALGYAIPKVVRLLTPGGVVPQRLPAEVQAFLPRSEYATDRPRESAAPLRMEVIPESKRHLFGWGIPLALLLGVAGLLWWLIPSRGPAPVANAVVQPRLWLSDNNGVASYSGLVRDEATRTSIVDALSSVFGADNIKGSIQVDPNVAPAPWLSNLRGALANLKFNSSQALFQGNSVSIGGVASDSDRNNLISKLQAVLGGDVTYGVLAKN